MISGFEHKTVNVSGLDLATWSSGTGSPILLLHGYPQSSYMWRFIAPELAKTHEVIMVDLPGYGESEGPEPDQENYAYSKRNSAKILVTLMTELGYEKFQVLGHDRGARVGFRMCLDYPDKVTAYCALDIVPTLSVWDNMDWKNAMGTYHWPFLAQPAPMPETLISAEPDHYMEHIFARWADDNSQLSSEAIAKYKQQFRSNNVIAASCADYRSGATTDVEHDREDQQKGNKIQCPVLAVYGSGFLKNMADAPRKEWEPWADNLQDLQLSCGHFVAEEAPDQCIPTILEFFNHN